jgi:hypothetical protein
MHPYLQLVQINVRIYFIIQIQEAKNLITACSYYPGSRHTLEWSPLLQKIYEYTISYLRICMCQESWYD